MFLRQMCGWYPDHLEGVFCWFPEEWEVDSLGLVSRPLGGICVTGILVIGRGGYVAGILATGKGL